ncbi:MAG: glucosidase [Porphyromonadaceae bacterium CG2_30_38_12]|nr:MAG: glucosidase [Porphyromonadaceae bacterium CG2_30_38_12]
MKNSAEKERLFTTEMLQGKWKIWGPYLSERQWGTVREDYSSGGNAWEHSSHEMARSLAYRWGEEGIGGISDDKQLLCMAPAFWNRKDAILKERLFGLTGVEGNHGEDVKEYYYYIDNTPTHSYMKMLYKYPQQTFPYENLVVNNKNKSKFESEFELEDTGILNEKDYFDIFIEYAKSAEKDIYVCITAQNKSTKPAPLDVIMQLWFRNTWSWDDDNYQPTLETSNSGNYIEAKHSKLDNYYLYSQQNAILFFCNNDTNIEKLYHTPSSQQYFKDGINDVITKGKSHAVNPLKTGTKAAMHCSAIVEAGAAQRFWFRLTTEITSEPFLNSNDILSVRKAEADEFYSNLQSGNKNDEENDIQRQALAGMLWGKQFYYFDIRKWLDGDSGQPKPPSQRNFGRNNGWRHFNCADIISMPDKWEYPWFAAWDLAFHCISLVLVDPFFAKNQLKLLTNEWYMHPNGQLPAYEWNFSDVNPPVHAWATWRVFKMDKKYNYGLGDYVFLETVFHKLLLNFTWWVNRKDEHNHNIFQGGFLGLDNIGVFDRSAQIPHGGHIEQADGTAWMAMFTLNMMRISLELAERNPVYEYMATKFFEHFLYIAGAMANIDKAGIHLWDDEDEFYYDVLHNNQGRSKLKVRTMVGLIPLFAVEVIDREILKKRPIFAARMNWFLEHRPDLAGLVSRWTAEGHGETTLFSLLRGHRLKCILKRMLDESEFLSDFGVRALSKYYEDKPYIFKTHEMELEVDYQPGESTTSMFGGNSNWRGPIWFPVNFLIIESLQRFHHYFGNDFKVEYPTNSGNYMDLEQISETLTNRLIRIFKKDINGKRPVYSNTILPNRDEDFNKYILFYEYFHGDSGKGLGASHQTGWTGLIAKLIQKRD